MKRVKTILVSLVVMIIAGVVLQSCSSDDDAGSSSPSTFIRFTIDGTDYELVNIITAESNSLTLNGNNGPNLNDPGDARATIWLPLVLENGTFAVEELFTSDHAVSVTIDALNFDFDFAESGSITLTQTTGGFIVGTFTATITNDTGATIVLENGSFRGESF